MAKAKLAWNWIQDHAGLLAAVVIAILGFVLFRRRQVDAVTSLQGALAVAKAERDVAKLTERRDAAVARADAKEPEIQALDGKLAETRRKIVEVRAGVAGLSDDQVLEAYRKLGYVK